MQESYYIEYVILSNHFSYPDCIAYPDTQIFGLAKGVWINEGPCTV